MEEKGKNTITSRCSHPGHASFTSACHIINIEHMRWTLIMYFLDLTCHNYNFAVKYKHNDSVYLSTLSIQENLYLEKFTPALQFDLCKEITALWEQ